MTGDREERPTWKDWIAREESPGESQPQLPGESELLRRDEVIARARELGARRRAARRPEGREVDERVMLYWESLGIIPAGTTPKRGYKYKLFPWWVVDMLYQVCRYEAAGLDLRDLPDVMHAEAERLARDPLPRRKQRRIPTQGDPDFWATIFDPDYRDRLREPTHPPFRRPRDAVYDSAAERLIGLLNTLSPSGGFSLRPSLRHPTRVRLSYVDEHGEDVRTYDVALDDPEAIVDFLDQDKRAYEEETPARQAHQAEMMEQVERWLGPTPDKN